MWIQKFRGLGGTNPRHLFRIPNVLGLVAVFLCLLVMITFCVCGVIIGVLRRFQQNIGVIPDH